MKELERENIRLKGLLADLSLGAQGRCLGKLINPERHRQTVEGIRGK